MIGRLFGAVSRIGGWVRSRFRAEVFRGSNSGRLFGDWSTAAQHPDLETRFTLRDLRARARDLVRNNPYAAGIVDSFTDNVIGWEGIRLHPEVRNRAGDVAEDTNARILKAWTAWGMDHASTDGVDSWLDLQRLIVRSWVVDGEVFIREHKGFDNPHAYALQLIDADLLDENYNAPPDSNGIEIRMGIEMDATGRRLAYHFWRRHPQDLPRGSRDRVRVPADEVIHFFTRLRVGQNRGYTLFAPVLSTLKMIDGYSEAELVAARLAAAKMGFIENITPEAIEAYAARLKALNNGQTGDTNPLEVAPGLIEELLPGQKFTAFDPNHPNAAFEVFLKVMLRGVSRGFGVSYLTTTGDLEGANYSSMRAGLLPERDHWRVLQVATYTRAHRRIYDSWRGTAMLAGSLRIGSLISANFAAHSWRPRGWKWVDPYKDLQAAELAIRLGVNSRTRVAADQGLDFRKIVDELRVEEDYADEKQVHVAGISQYKPGGQGDDEADEPEPATNGNGNGSNPRNRLTKVLTNGK